MLALKRRSFARLLASLSLLALLCGAFHRHACSETATAAALDGLRDLPNLADGAERISQSIVSIGAVRTVVDLAWYGDFFAPFYVPLEKRRERVPYLGSGIIVTEDGLVLTNQHVVEGAQDIFVTMPDGRELSARLIDADKTLDVAVLRLDCDKCVPAMIGDSDKLRIGEWVLAVGNPFGNLIGDPHPTVTVGVISALNRSFSPRGENDRVYPNMIQTDAAINPGNSGGPLVDAHGRVMGINTFIFSRSGGSQGIGFAIPINRAMRVVDEVRRYGRIRHLDVDFDVMDIPPRRARAMGLPSSRGVFVHSVTRGGVAAKAGLRAGDMIVAVGDQACYSARVFWNLYAGRYVGDGIALTILRGDRRLKVEFTIKEGGN